MNTFRKYATLLLILIYGCGAIGIWYRPDFFLPFTPWSLLYSALWFWTYQPFQKMYWLNLIIIALLTWLVEVIGVHTGLLFGEYHYGKILGYQVMGVPFIIGINWALLLSATSAALAPRISNRFVWTVLSALLVCGIDALIEPLAPKLDYWYFSDGLAGIQNYLAWFGVAAICLWPSFPVLRKGNPAAAWLILLLQVLFFIFLHLFLFLNH